MDALNTAKAISRLIKEKKGEDTILLDVKEISPITDYFVITTGLSRIHTRAIADYIIEKESEPDHIEGMESANWILLDYLDFVIHIFTKKIREFYGLERLWGDAPRVDFNE